MNLVETGQLLKLVAVHDNRDYQKPGAAEFWHEILGHNSFEDCKTALINARQRDDITWLEPKHLVRELVKLRERRQTDERRVKATEEKENFEGVTMPLCRHGLGLLKCDPCCNAVYRNHTEKHHGQEHGDSACQAFIREMSVD